MVMLFALLLVSLSASGAPARLQGYSWRQDLAESWEEALDEETVSINDAWEATKEYDDPSPPPYLDEDGKDVRYGAAVGDDKYRLAPIYSLQKLYDIKSGKVEDPSEVEDDEEEEGEEEGEDGEEDEEDDEEEDE
jgi:hypothetical protein